MLAFSAACAGSALAQGVQNPVEPGSRIRYSVEAMASSYQYKETALDGSEVMRLKGARGGIAGRADRISDNGVFVGGELRVSYGRPDYRSAESGTMNGLTDYYYDLRFLAGRNFDLGTSVVAPYVGYGYRKLINNSEGKTTSVGDVGYYRASAYRYVPIGADWTIRLGNGQSLSVNAEYDYLIRGTQKSELPGEPIKNTQNRGWGARGSIMYGFGKWSAGPYVDYWRIARSNIDCFFVCYVEPKNVTTDAGVRVRYVFQ